jgi:hypothetical protein
MSEFDLYMRRAAVRDKFFNLSIRYEFYNKSLKQFLAFLNTPDDEKWATPLPPGVTVRQLYDAASDATEDLQAEVAQLEEQRVAARTASEMCLSVNRQHGLTSGKHIMRLARHFITADWFSIVG